MRRRRPRPLRPSLPRHLRFACLALLAACSSRGGSEPGAVPAQDEAGGSAAAGSSGGGAPNGDDAGRGSANPSTLDSGAAPARPSDASADRTVTQPGNTGNPGPSGGSGSGGGASEGGGAALDAGAGVPRDGATSGGISDASPGDGGFTLPITNAGCSNANPPTGSLNLPIGGNQANYIVTLPNGYRANSPVPLVFGFHGRNRTNSDFEDVDALSIKTEMAPFAIMVYPKSQGGPGWEQTGELPLNIQFFEAMWTQMFSNYCVDPARVFVIGHSSGAMFSNILACRYGDRLRGVGAVAGQQLETTCVGNVAAMIIHGGQDPLVANSLGRASRDFYLQRNGCQMTTTPGEVPPCVAYTGCAAGLPVEWCEHTEPTYTMTDGGGHGYPTFASRAMWRFFSPLTPKMP